MRDAVSVAHTPRTEQRPETLQRRILKAVGRPYMRVWHHLRVEGMDRLPPHGPALVMINHTSILDVVALMAADPYPDTAMVVKASAVRLPIVGQLLSAWYAIGIERDGRDLAGARALLAALRQGRVVALAPEGQRSRDGHLGEISPLLGRLAVRANVPVVPVGITGSFEALPPGAIFPRPRPIVLHVGEPLYFPNRIGDEQAACCIRDAIAALLSPEENG